MGKCSIRRRRKKDHDVSSNKSVTQNYVSAESDKTNENFFAFYKSQGIVSEDEWDAFIAAFKEDLPTSFRIHASSKEAESLIELMDKRYFEKMKFLEDGDIFVPKPLSWYPCAYQTPMSRSLVRSHPVLKEFHNFLVTEVELGNISRQEAVSMIPPLLLDVKPHHKVLDVCAAPGSKTMQIIEMMHDDDKISDGFIVANDADNSRCYLLVRQVLKRMPTSNCIVINENASCLPNLTLNNNTCEPLLFDRVLCDVICSGDGTFRKNPDLWKSWSLVKALGLHKLQVNIARRATQLLAVGGLMVYSTCSLNPIEDEAVIASLLRHTAGTLELVDVSQQLSQLKRASGLSNWKVFDKTMREYNRIEDVDDDQKRYFTSSMFPPNEEEIQKFNLNRCFRILPHMQNTGGFFVAVLRKLKSLNETQSMQCSNHSPMKRRRTYKEDPFVFLEEDDVRWKDIANHYGVSEDFPYQNLLGRTYEAGKKRTLFFVNSAVKQFLLCNQDKVKVINAGIRMFERVRNKYDLCRFRMSQDGVKTILPFMEKRVVEIDVEDMRNILKTEIGNFPRNKLQCDLKLCGFSSGSIVLVTEFRGMRQVICAWMGAKSVTPYVSKEQRIHALRMLDGDTSELENVMWSKRQQKALRERDKAGKIRKLKQLNGSEERREEMNDQIREAACELNEHNAEDA